MSAYAPITERDNWFIGEDRTFDFYMVQGVPVVLRASTLSGGTVLAVEPLEVGLADATVLQFVVPRKAPLPPRIVGVTLNGVAAAGATSVTVVAVTAHLRREQFGYPTLDMSGYSLEWVLRDTPGGATAHISKATSGSGIVIGNGLATGDKATVTVADADTVDLSPREYFHTLRRTDNLNENVLAYGPALLREAGTR